MIGPVIATCAGPFTSTGGSFIFPFFPFFPRRAGAIERGEARAVNSLSSWNWLRPRFMLPPFGWFLGPSRRSSFHGEAFFASAPNSRRLPAEPDDPRSAGGAIVAGSQPSPAGLRVPATWPLLLLIRRRRLWSRRRRRRRRNPLRVPRVRRASTQPPPPPLAVAARRGRRSRRHDARVRRLGDRGGYRHALQYCRPQRRSYVAAA